MSGKEIKPKKRLVISYNNLSEELLELVKKKYPTGYADSMIRIDKPSGDFFYAIVLETDEVSYLIKVDVKIDTKLEEEEDKDFFDSDIDEAGDEIAEEDADNFDEDE